MAETLAKREESKAAQDRRTTQSQVVESKPLVAEAKQIAPSPFRRVMTRRNSELDTSENLLTTFGALAS